MSTLPATAQEQLRRLIEQIENLEAEKKAIADNIRDKYAEAKSVGFDTKALRAIVKARKKSKTEREEEDAILGVYLHALGMASGGEETAPEDFGKPDRQTGKLPALAMGYDALSAADMNQGDIYANAAAKVFGPPAN